MTEPKHAVTEFPTAQFHEWLAKQPGEREFHYFSHCGCLFASFCKEALGYTNPQAGGIDINLDEGDVMLIPLELHRAASRAPDTFTIEQFRHELSKQKEQAV